MKRLWIAILLSLSLIPLGIALAQFSGAASQRETADPETPTPSQAERAAIQDAVRQAAAQRAEQVPAFLFYDVRLDRLSLSADGLWAVAWLAFVDRASGEVVPSEPGLALAQRQGGDNRAWEITLQADAVWASVLQAVPEELLDAPTKAEWLGRRVQAIQQMAITPSNGYCLPWAKGVTRILSGSTFHDSYLTDGSAHYAFDFVAPGNAMFELRAARAGTVFIWDDHWPNGHDSGGSSEVNYIVLKDTSTTPTSYQLYLHLAQNSIPASLKQVGTPVFQGQVVGWADDTGMSTANHLHFQVHTAASWWGNSVDIQFRDVSINGGRPRIAADVPYCDWPGDVCTQTQSSYTASCTGDGQPPSGALTAPAHQAVITTTTVTLAGWASDVGSGVERAQFVAAYDGTWHNIGPAFQSGSFSYDWDFCATEGGVSNGPISLALDVMDLTGNFTQKAGLISVLKNTADCPVVPPNCLPAANQVTLFAGPNYTGACSLYSVGNFDDLDDQAASLWLGEAVQATLYLSNTFQQRGETFFVNDNSLADNLIGLNRASSLQVAANTLTPLTPTLRLPASGAASTLGDVVTLFWENGGGAVEYQVQLTSSVTATLSLPWQPDPFVHLEALAAGAYSWRVRGRNPAGEGPWSAPRPFTVTVPTPTPTPTPKTVPFTDTMEASPGNWSASGLWRWVTSSSQSHGGSHSWWYQQSDGDYANGSANEGSLTSVPITITSSGYYLRFYYKVETESPGPRWDQRWLQISTDGGPFRQVWQFTDEPTLIETTTWLQSPPLDLTPYRGHVIRLRFTFQTLDANLNAFDGWGIDDVTITAAAPPCSHDGDDEPATAVPITYTDSLSAEICPNGDVDFYRFEGQAGELVGVEIEAQSFGSPLDAYLTLLGSDGLTVLAENDDDALRQSRDPRLQFRLPATGTYYVNVRAWNHPKAGGTNDDYTLHLNADDQFPTVTLTNPSTGAWLPGSLTVSANAADLGSGIQAVQFFWHSGTDWSDPLWQLLGSDDDGSNGWSVVTDTTPMPAQVNAALYARAIDWAGNTAVSAAWNLKVDHTPPVVVLSSLPAQADATLIALQWSASDDFSGLAQLDLEWSVNGGAFADYAPPPALTDTHLWVIGAAGNSYAFRLRASDAAGNRSAFSQVATTIPSVEVLCSAPDEWEVDNAVLSATLITTDTVQIHNFCNPLTGDRLNDEDWLALDVIAGEAYHVSVNPLSESAAVIVELFDSDGKTLLASDVPSGFGDPTGLSWVASESERLYIRMHHLNGDVAGNGVSYRISTRTYVVYLPIIER